MNLTKMSHYQTKKVSLMFFKQIILMTLKMFIQVFVKVFPVVTKKVGVRKTIEYQTWEYFCIRSDLPRKCLHFCYNIN